MKQIKMVFLAILVIFLSGTVKVNAIHTCKYGRWEGNEWIPVLDFKIFDYDDMMLRLDYNYDFFMTGESGLEEEITLVEGNGTDCQNCDFMDEDDFLFNYYFFVALYANEEDYSIQQENFQDYCADKGLNVDDGSCAEYEYLACPKFLQVSTNLTSGRDAVDREVYYIFYTDALTEESKEGFSWSNIWTSDLHNETVYSLEQYKHEEVPEDLRTSSNCNTYDSYMRSIKRAIEEKGTCEDNNKLQDSYNKLLRLCENYRASSDYAEGGLKVSGCMTACSGLRDDIANLCGIENDAPANDGSCYSLGSGVLGWIMKILNMIRYIVPVLLILLGILDFIKAIASEDEGEIKKSGTKFVKRLIAAALIFIVPLILQFVLGMFNLPGLDPSNPYCTR